MSRTASRSKYAVDLFWRLWDEPRSRWVNYQGKSMWTLRSTVEKIRQRMIDEGRNPSTLTIERVQVEVK